MQKLVTLEHKWTQFQSVNWQSIHAKQLLLPDAAWTRHLCFLDMYAEPTPLTIIIEHYRPACLTRQRLVEETWSFKTDVATTTKRAVTLFSLSLVSAHRRVKNRSSWQSLMEMAMSKTSHGWCDTSSLIFCMDNDILMVYCIWIWMIHSHTVRPPTVLSLDSWTPHTVSTWVIFFLQ